MARKIVRREASKRDAIPNVNFLTIGGLTVSLGDIRKSDFSSIKNPKASVKSCQDTLIAILDVLRGFSET